MRTRPAPTHAPEEPQCIAGSHERSLIRIVRLSVCRDRSAFCIDARQTVVRKTRASAWSKPCPSYRRSRASDIPAVFHQVFYPVRFFRRPLIREPNVAVAADDDCTVRVGLQFKRRQLKARVDFSNLLR